MRIRMAVSVLSIQMALSSIFVTSSYGQDYDTDLELYQGSVGCRFYLRGPVSGPNLYVWAHILDPFGDERATGEKQTYSALLQGEFEGPVLDTGTHTCEAWYYVDGNLIGQETRSGTFTAQEIWTAIASDSGNVDVPPNRKRRDLWYQIYEGQQIWKHRGRVRELWSFSSNPCNLPFVTGEYSVDSVGRFPDTYFTDERCCTQGCVVQAVQRLYLSTAKDREIRANNVDFRCSGITITERP
jgi:hypothetical protein